MPEQVDNSLIYRGALSPVDRFGYPVRWSIEFRRTALRFLDFQNRLSTEEVRLYNGLRNWIDDQAEHGLGKLEHSVYNLRGVLFGGVHSVTIIISFPIRIGGMRLLLTVSKMLKLSGIEVHIILRRGATLDAEAAGLFDSVTVTVDEASFRRHLENKCCSLFLLGSWVDCAETAMAVDLCNSSIVIFTAGEPTLNSDSFLDARFMDYRNSVFQLPVHILAFSRFAQDLIRRVHNRQSYYVPVPLDPMFFAVRAAPQAPTFRIALNGSLNNPQKAVSSALHAVAILRMRGVPTEVTWISQDLPAMEIPHYFRLLVDVAPIDVASALASCDVLLFPSIVEGLGLPPLEAMAIGVPVVLAMNEGVAEYAVPNWNCLMVRGRDASALADAADRIRTDPSLRAYLIQNGLQTAARFSLEATRVRLSNALACVAAVR